MALLLGFSVNAMAAQALFYTEKERLPTAPAKELEVYGSVRVWTYWQTFDKENATATGNRFDDSDLIWGLDDGSSRFGVRFKSGKVGANIEIRPRDRQRVRDRTLTIGGEMDLLRHWYGSYDLGFGTFIVGQTWAPTYNPICKECLLGGSILDNYGDTGLSSRLPGLQLHIPIPALKGLFKFALLTPHTDFGGQVLPAPYSDVDTTIPKIEASLSGAFGPLSFMVRGGYNTFDEASITTDDTQSVDSWVFAGDLTYSIGSFYVRGTGYLGQNLTVYGVGAAASAMGLFPQAFVGNTIEDVDNWGWFGVVGYKFNDLLSIEAGYGMRHSELDNPVTGFTGEDEASAFVVFLPISITPAFIITPEILWTDEGDLTSSTTGLTTDRGNRLYYGIYWRIDF